MVTVVIGVDPHKASHTAVAINAAEEPLGELRVRASAVQAERLLGWAQAWPGRIWAVEGAGGIGHLLAWQLLSAGERVLDVPPTLAARVRLLATGASTRTIPMTHQRFSLDLETKSCSLCAADGDSALGSCKADRLVLSLRSAGTDRRTAGVASSAFAASRPVSRCLASSSPGIRTRQTQLDRGGLGRTAPATCCGCRPRRFGRPG